MELEFVKEMFSSLNSKKTSGYVAPHKAVMMVTVIDCISNGYITNGFIPINDSFRKAFERTWGEFVLIDSPFSISFTTPFYHLDKEPFWTLMKTDEYVKRHEYSIGQLRTSFFGAKIDDDLWEILEVKENREILRNLLIGKFLKCYSPDYSFDSSELYYGMLAEEPVEYNNNNSQSNEYFDVSYSKEMLAKRHIWVYWPGDYACLFPENVKNGFMCCRPKGNEVGDMDEIIENGLGLEQAVINAYGYKNNKAMKLLRQFYCAVKEGDIIIARSSNDSIVGIGIVTGDYFYDNSRPFYRHCRPVFWTHKGNWPASSFLHKVHGNRVTEVKPQFREDAENIICSIK